MAARLGSVHETLVRLSYRAWGGGEALEDALGLVLGGGGADKLILYQALLSRPCPRHLFTPTVWAPLPSPAAGTGAGRWRPLQQPCPSSWLRPPSRPGRARRHLRRWGGCRLGRHALLQMPRHRGIAKLLCCRPSCLHVPLRRDSASQSPLRLWGARWLASHSLEQC